METVEVKPSPASLRRMAENIRHGLVSNAQAGKSYSTVTNLRVLIELAVHLSHEYPKEYDKLMNPLNTSF